MVDVSQTQSHINDWVMYSLRLGQLKAGDRVLAINSIALEGVTLHTAIKLANEMKECVTMTVEFEVEGITSF